jgi:hypothetical protein
MVILAPVGYLLALLHTQRSTRAPLNWKTVPAYLMLGFIGAALSPFLILASLIEVFLFIISPLEPYWEARFEEDR